MFFPTNNNDDCDCSYLEDQNDRLKEENRRLEEERQQQRKIYKEARESELWTASNWREALEKQAILYGREARQYPELNEDGIDEFEVSADACLKACEIWDSISSQIKLEVTKKLRDYYQNKPGFKWIESYVISPLEDEENVENWLDW